jgi:tetratricopeptide (TPR) repeat protein
VVQASALFEQRQDETGIIRALNERAQLQALTGDYEDALATYREALARVHTLASDPRLEMTIRLNLCRLHRWRGRFPDAEDEMRRAEETAIVHNFTHQLARVYLLMGEVRGAQQDDTGFIFFEKAIELCRGTEPALRLEGEVYLRYGQFRLQLGDREEGRAYLERARDVLSGFANGPYLAVVEAELAQFEMT